MIERETGEISREPLTIATDDPVICTIYTKIKKLLEIKKDRTYLKG